MPPLAEPSRCHRCPSAPSLALALVVTIVLAALPARGGGSPVVAVFNIEARRAQLSSSTLQALSDYLAGQLAAGGAFSVVPRERLKRELTRKKNASYRECYSQSCQIEIGQELAAQKVVSTQILKLANKCVVTATVLDLRRAATDRAATEEGGCSEAALMAALRAVARKLGSVAVESPDPAAPHPTPRASTPAPTPTPIPAEGPPVEPEMSRGPEKAPVFVEEFTDYQCPFCRNAHQALREVVGKLSGKMRHLHRDYPLDSACNPRVSLAMHPMACRAAYYARCAAAQGKFTAMDDALFAGAELSEEGLRAAAKGIGLDAGRLQSCLASPRVRRAVLADIALAAGRGVSGTPCAFVNGERVVGARDAAWWEQKIRELLGR